MIANHTSQVINRLAKKTWYTNKGKFQILFFTVALSSFMLFSVFTIGINYLNLSRLQNTRLNGAEYDALIMNGFTDVQKSVLENNSDIQSVGAQSYAGYVKSTDTDDTINIGLVWNDEVFWEKQNAPARTKTEGHYPQQENELMVNRKALKECGIDNLGVGDSFSMTYEDNRGIQKEDFVISGIWEGYGNKSAFYVSREFFDKTGYQLESDGILCIKLSQNYVTHNTIKKIEQNLMMTERQVFQVSNYIENSLKILLGICGLCFIICLSAYLLIYNILFLSVSGKIRYYGLLQTLGMTKKQLVQFVKRQMLGLGAAGILLGIILGIVTSLILVPYVMKVLGISYGTIEIHFYPAVVIISVMASAAAILCGIRKPVHIAANVVPVEAVKYHGASRTKTGYKKVKKGNFSWKMAREELIKDKKKTLVVFLSLAASLSVFYCFAVIIYSQGERTIMADYWDADLIIRNDTQTSENINSIEPALNHDFIHKLNKIDGIKEIHTMMALPVVIPFSSGGFPDMWMEKYVQIKSYLSYSDIVSDYKQNPEKYFGMIKGIDEAEFDYLNQQLSMPVDKKSFLDGQIGIIQYCGFEIPQEYTKDKTITFYSEKDKIYEIPIGAVSYEGYYGASTNIGATIIVSQDYLKTITEDPFILSLNIKYKEPYDKVTEKQIYALFDDNPYRNDLYFESKLENMKTLQEAQGNMMEIGTVIALMLLLVGILNYANTMASSIQNRQVILSIMESLGMTQKQIKQLLIREGILYALCSILITLTAGTMITYVCFQSVNYMEVPFTIPILPLLCAILLVLIVCAAVPLFSYKKLSGKQSLSERIRQYK